MNHFNQNGSVVNGFWQWTKVQYGSWVRACLPAYLLDDSLYACSNETNHSLERSAACKQFDLQLTFLAPIFQAADNPFKIAKSSACKLSV
jgi:hypothetical protein